MSESYLKGEFEKRYREYLEKFDQTSIENLTSKIKLLCGIHGILFRCKDQINRFRHIPVTLFPSPFPKEHFLIAKSMQQEINTLFLRISSDHSFLIKSLEQTCAVDPFIEKLVSILQLARKYEFTQKIQVGIIRSDYMLHDDRRNSRPLRLYLVEYNTISVSFGAHAVKMQKLHRNILDHSLGFNDSPQPAIHGDSCKNKICDGIFSFYQILH